MSGPKIEMPAGKRFGCLVLTGVFRQRGRPYFYQCICDCGRTHEVGGARLRSGQTTMCKACQLAAFQEARVSHGHTRGRRRSPEYSSWMSMRIRCCNPNSDSYPNYGGRGVTICERWASFENFLADMGPKPTPRMTIERKENAGNYEPGNCVWATYKAQARNHRRNRIVTYGDRQLPLAEAVEMARADGHRVSYGTAFKRLSDGWTDEAALTLPVRKRT